MKKLLLGATAASLLVAAVVTVVSLLQTPTYEVSALVVVHPKEQSDGKIQLIPNAPTPESLRALVRTMALAIEIRPGPKRPSAVWGWRCPRTSSWTP